MFNKSGLQGDLIRIVLYGVGLSSLAAVVYLAAPYVVIGEWRPLENFIIRDICILLLVTIVGSVGSWRFLKRRKAVAALAEGISGEAAQPEDDTEELSDRMKDALGTLKATSGGKGDFLYDLPWYIIIGPPGSGKTTALVNSGLKFPLSNGATPAAVAGQGGTRYCDWWFTEDAVLIDTAGRYTTQDSDAAADKQSWFGFLDLLKKNRPKQPINGVLLAISLHDVLTLTPEELAAHSRAIRARLVELHDRLKIDFPVYALFTKGDLVAGFMEYFGNLNEIDRRHVWGATFQGADKKRNMVSEVPTEFDKLIERINQEMMDRLQEEPSPGTRASLYGFAAQMASLKRPLHDFLNAVFEPTRYHASATLRGFYFTSGTQQGTPIDQLINALVKNFGAQEVGGATYSGLGKSFFLTDLIQKVIIGEAAWVSTDVGAVRRSRLLMASLYAGMLALSLGLTAAWAISYSRNNTLINATDSATREYAATVGPLASETVISDRDYYKVLPYLQKLRSMPTGYGHEGEGSVAETFGLDQRDRLETASVGAYRMALERLFRPRLLYRLEEALDEHRDDPSYVYDALKVYLMLGGQHRPVDRDFVVAWERQDWADNLYKGAGQESGRQQLEGHLAALLALGGETDPVVQVSQTVIEDSQRTLARLSISQRAYELLKSQARALNIPDWVATRSGGADFERVFEGANGAPLESVRVPGFYTYAGFQRAYLEKLPGIADRIKNEQWVLGDLAKQSTVAEQYTTLLTNDLPQLYTKDFVAAWIGPQGALSKLQVKRLNDKPRYFALEAAAAANSPIKTLFESIRDETALTRKRDIKPADQKPKEGASGSMLTDPAQNPDQRIESEFREYHKWVDGTPPSRPIDELVALLHQIQDNLITAVNVPSQAAFANTQVGPLLERFNSLAGRLPPPFATMMARASSDFQNDALNVELGQLRKALADQVGGYCSQAINGRYPFNRGASAEVAIQDFGKIFGTGGVLDQFFQTSLKKYVDTSKRDWKWRADQPLSSRLSVATLREFQRANDIRNAFFGTGGNMPLVQITVYPPVLSVPAGGGPSVTARFEMNGQFVQTQSGTSVSPGSLQWPGAAAGGRSAVILSYETPPPAPSLFPGAQAQPAPAIAPSTLQRTGPWSLFRLLDAGHPVLRGDKLSASFIVGGRELQYQFAVGSTLNPFTLPALSEFRCPTGI